VRLLEVGSLRRLFVQALETDFSYFPAEHIAQVKRANTTARLIRRAVGAGAVCCWVAVQSGPPGGLCHFQHSS